MNTSEIQPQRTPKAIVNWLYAEFLNKGNLDVADQFISPDYNCPTGNGPEGFKALVSPLREGFPDLQFAIQDVVVEGSRAVVRWTSEGTHRGLFAGAAPTGRRVFNEGIAIYRIVDGKVAEAWSQMDRLGVLQQIGVVPPIARGGHAHQTKSPDRA